MADRSGHPSRWHLSPPFSSAVRQSSALGNQNHSDGKAVTVVNVHGKFRQTGRKNFFGTKLANELDENLFGQLAGVLSPVKKERSALDKYCPEESRSTLHKYYLVPPFREERKRAGTT